MAVAGLRIATEKCGDEGAVRAILLGAFPGQEEADLVEALRRCSEFNPDWSLVAWCEQAMIGHALITEAWIDGDSGASMPALALAPVAVAPSHQRQGVGTTLVRTLISTVRRTTSAPIIVLGDRAYYERFGFVPADPFGVHPPHEWPADAFQILPAQGASTQAGVVRYLEPFDRVG